MGILDEAIREHLALKRRQGLSDDELRRLEDEAFGPPARPGEPDFPDQEAEEPAAEEHEALAESEPERVLEETSGQPTLEGADAGSMDVGDGTVTVVEAEVVEEGEGFRDDIGAGPPTEEAEAEIAPEPERVHGDELDIEDLELELDEAVAEGGEPEQGGPPEPEAAPPVAPVESLETVEHPIEEELEEVESDEYAFDEEELEEGELEEGEPDEEEPAVEEGGEGAEEGEDVLEETPDFLRDAPEDDELWFEQGEPKDFDF